MTACPLSLRGSKSAPLRSAEWRGRRSELPIHLQRRGAARYNQLSKIRKLVNQTSRLRSSFVLALFFALGLGLGSCSDGDSNGASAQSGTPAPLTETDLAINEYDKTVTEFVRVARRFKGGDLSVTVRYLELSTTTKEQAAKLQQDPAKLNPQQTARVAEISARAAPFLQS